MKISNVIFFYLDISSHNYTRSGGHIKFVLYKNVLNFQNQEMIRFGFSSLNNFLFKPFNDKKKLQINKICRELRLSLFYNILIIMQFM